MFFKITNSEVRFLVVNIIGCVVISILFSYIVSLFDSRDFSIDIETTFDHILLILIVPFIETYLFQKIPIDYAIDNNYKSKTIVIIVTGFIFSIYHLRGLLNSIPIFITGMYLSYIYYHLKKMGKFAFVGTFLTHSIVNFTVIILSYYFG